MKISLNWLSEFIDLPTADAGELATVLAGLGHEVEGVEELTAGWTGVSIARVLTVEAHPDADRVRLCTVTTGGDPIQVVCGAWNFDVGAMVAFAHPGAVLPGGFEIGSRDIRGVTSNGMICSEKELRLGEDHSGILVLEPDAPAGLDFAEWVDLPDVVFDLTITPNRPDAMSVLGVARDLAAFYGLVLRMPDASVDTVPGIPAVTVDIQDPTGCFRFTARQVDGISVGPSPFWMRHRLRVSGMRPISNAVDVTNYVMWELGHPLHAFDVEKVDGGRLVVRRARADETMVTLDDVERALVPDDLVICDVAGPTSMAGTMGGAMSEVQDGSTSILLEAASWDPPTIMNMSRRHGLRSEASARFERGVDRELPLLASARAARLLVATAGGTVRAGVVDETAVPFERRLIDLTVGDVRRVLGDGFPADEVAQRLRSIGLDVEGADPMTVEVPGFRPDLERPIDLIEEVARLHGLENFGMTVPTGRGSGWSAEQHRTRLIRSVLTGAGLSQAIHLSFIGSDDLDALGYPPDHVGRSTVQVRNPLREEEAILRTTLLPGLLRSTRYNISHGAGSVALFEIGKVFFDRSDPADARIPDQPDRLGFVIAGAFGGDALDVAARPVDVYTATAVWRVIVSALGLDDVATVRPASPAGLHPGRSAEVLIGGTPVGVVGELHPSAADHYEIDGRVAVGEIDLALLSAPVLPVTAASPSTYPRVEFDLAFAVEATVAADDVLRAVGDAGGDLVERARVFDEYVGLEGGRKSIGIRVVLRASDRTLTGDDVTPVRRDMIEAAAALGAELRGGG